MTTPNRPPMNRPKLYPPLAHRFSPTISRWVPLRASDIHSLRTHEIYDSERELFYFSNTNHPVKWVRVVGIVVAVDEFDPRIVYTLDDGSGMGVECVCFGPGGRAATITAQGTGDGKTEEGKAGDKRKRDMRETTRGKQNQPAEPSVKHPLVPYESIDVGSLVKIKGEPSSFRNMNRVSIVKAEVMHSTEQEMKCWNETLTFRTEILEKPWILTKEEEDKCQRLAQRMAQDGQSKNPKNGHRRVQGREMSKRKESEEERRQRKAKQAAETESERRARKELERRRMKEKETGKGASGLDPANKVNYPSLAVRKMVKGKYDALGI